MLNIAPEIKVYIKIKTFICLKSETDIFCLIFVSFLYKNEQNKKTRLNEIARSRFSKSSKTPKAIEKFSFELFKTLWLLHWIQNVPN